MYERECGKPGERNKKGKGRKKGSTGRPVPLLVDFLLNPDLKKIGAINEKYWARAWRFRGEGARRMIDALAKYRQVHNWAEEGKRNWSAHDVDTLITNAVEAGILVSFEISSCVYPL